MIPIKTVPVAAGNQFMIFPSDNAGLGGVSIAINDMTLYPFVNPAKGSRLRGGRVSGSPGFYHITEDNGSARTLPVGVSWGGSRWFFGGALAFQELDVGDANGFGGFDDFGSPLSRSSATNTYLSGFGGAKLNDSGLALGGSVYWAGLDGLDGVVLLYSPWSSVVQSGHLLDLRMGLTQDWHDGGQGEFVLVHNRFDMSHEITEDFARPWIGMPEPVEPIGPGIPVPPPPPEPLIRTERDETTTWGAHLGYQRPVGKDGWRVGGILTGNWKTHPKIPDYDIMNIPRDPGNSWAYNFGAGVAYEHEGTTFGLDAVYEPIWSDTWVEAPGPVQTASGRVIEAGGRTLENDFRFSNKALRTGIGHAATRWGAQLGVQVRSCDYELEQVDLVGETFRRQNESWLEWTPTWAVLVKLDNLSIQYAGHTTTGAGRPGTAGGRLEASAPGLDVGTNFLAAPDGPLTLQDARVMAHRLSVAVPFG